MLRTLAIICFCCGVIAWFYALNISVRDSGALIPFANSFFMVALFILIIARDVEDRKR